MVKAEKYSIHDYERTPEGVAFEVIDGEPQVTPAPFLYHQEVLQRLYEAFAGFVRPRSLGRIYIAPCDVVLSDHDIVQPDLLFVSAARLGILTEKNVAGAPDVVVEVFAEASAYRDLVVKKRLYAVNGIREYWLADLQGKRLEILGLPAHRSSTPQGSEGGRDGAYETIATSEGATPVAGRVLDGFAVVPASIF